MSPQKEAGREAPPARQPSDAPGTTSNAPHPTRDHRPEALHDQEEPSDPRAADRLREEQATPPEPDLRARSSIERAIARGRQAWPSGPSLELRLWGQLDGLALGGETFVAFVQARAMAAGLCLHPDELLLAAAGFAAAGPELVARHLERAGRVA